MESRDCFSIPEEGDKGRSACYHPPHRPTVVTQLLYHTSIKNLKGGNTMKTSIALLVFLFGANILLGCSSTVTQAHREESARPGIEQRALSRAMDEAFSKVDFSVVGNKRVYVETKGLSKIDMPFVTSLISSKIIENGGLPVDKEETADIKTLTIVKVSGT